jgi:hypothetical protein
VEVNLTTGVITVTGTFVALADGVEIKLGQATVTFAQR